MSPFPFGITITWKCMCLLSKTELTGIYTMRRKIRLHLQSKLVGKGYLHIGTNTFYFPLSRWKNTCYCTANILVTCAKSQKWRETALLSKQRKNLHLLWQGQQVQHWAHHLFLSAKEPNVYFRNKAITNSQSCFPKKFSSISRIFLCSAKYRGSTTATRATSVGCGVTRRGNWIFCDFAVTAEAAQCEIHIGINFSFCLHSIYPSNS